MSNRFRLLCLTVALCMAAGVRSPVAYAAPADPASAALGAFECAAGCQQFLWTVLANLVSKCITEDSWWGKVCRATVVRAVEQLSDGVLEATDQSLCSRAWVRLATEKTRDARMEWAKCIIRTGLALPG